MGKKGIKVGSVTFAIKGKDLLLKNGYKAYITRNLHPDNGEGCGYIIYVANFDKNCVRLLTGNGIKVFGLTDEGGAL